MASFYARNGAGELLARYSFIEPLLEGKRVLEVDGALATGGGGALFLAERGAAAVLSIESSEDRLEGARDAGHHPFVQYRAADPRELRAGAFDLVLVADGAALVRDPARLAAIRRLLAPGGRLATALSAGGAGLAELAAEPAGEEPPPYEAFVGALADHFPLVEVATQSATVGWVLALSAEGEGEPEVAMDGTLAGTPETAAWVAICGEEPCGLAGLSVVALPVKPLLDAALEAQASRGASEEDRRRAEMAEAARHEALAALSSRADELDQAFEARDDALRGREAARAERDEAVSARDAALAEAAEARAAMGAVQHELEELRARGAAAEAALERARAEAAPLADRARELEALVEAEREAAFEARAALDRARGSVADRLREADEARAAAQAQADASVRAQAELAERRNAALESEAALRAARAEAQAAKAAVEAVLARAVGAEGRVAELEEELDVRAQEQDRERTAARDEIARLSSELEGARTFAAESAGIRAEADVIRQEAERAREEIARLSSELEQLRAAAADAEVAHRADAGRAEALTRAEADRDEARRELEALRAHAGDGERAREEAERLRGELARA
ncbi:MAG TPA: methyltransferase domain-containing protein, partial [Anaeromyxobacter sp.]|nr:methyltransferase domain-containing protein [Anaeromyxobacter sp.]